MKKNILLLVTIMLLLSIAPTALSVSPSLTSNTIFNCLYLSPTYDLFCNVLKAYGLGVTGENLLWYRHNNGEIKVYEEDSPESIKLMLSSTFIDLFVFDIDPALNQALKDNKYSVERDYSNGKYTGYRFEEVKAQENAFDYFATALGFLPHLDDFDSIDTDNIKKYVDFDAWNAIASCNVHFSAEYSQQNKTWEIFVEIVDLYDFHAGVTGQGGLMDAANDAFSLLEAAGICTPFEVAYKIRIKDYSVSNAQIISAEFKNQSINIGDYAHAYAKTTDDITRVELVSLDGEVMAHTNQFTTFHDGEKEWDMAWLPDKSGLYNLTIRAIGNDTTVESNLVLDVSANETSKLWTAFAFNPKEKSKSASWKNHSESTVYSVAFCLYSENTNIEGKDGLTAFRDAKKAVEKEKTDSAAQLVIDLATDIYWKDVDEPYVDFTQEYKEFMKNRPEDHNTLWYEVLVFSR